VILYSVQCCYAVHWTDNYSPGTRHIHLQTVERLSSCIVNHRRIQSAATYVIVENIELMSQCQVVIIRRQVCHQQPTCVSRAGRRRVACVVAAMGRNVCMLYTQVIYATRHRYAVAFRSMALFHCLEALFCSANTSIFKKNSQFTRKLGSHKEIIHYDDQRRQGQKSRTEGTPGTDNIRSLHHYHHHLFPHGNNRLRFFA